MSIIDQSDTAGLLSRQVTGARYFFLRLAPRRGARLELVMGGFEHCNPDYVVARSHFPYSSIEYVVSGRGSVKFGRDTHELRPGAIFAYGPSTRHEIHTAPQDVLVKYFISVSGGDVPARLRRCRISPGQPRYLAAHADLAGAFDDLLREGQRAGPRRGRGGAPGRARLCAALLEFLLLKIEDSTSLAPRVEARAHESFRRCKALIDGATERLRTLGEIAKAVGAETSTVCRWFRRYQGMSPYQYLLRRRMTLAAEKLVEHGGLIKEVSQRLGFADPFHFSRQFKAVHGVSPSALRRYKSRPAKSPPRPTRPPRRAKAAGAAPAARR